MIVEIIIQGRIKNQVVEKTVPDASLVAWLTFINEHGLFLEDKWIPSSRIKEVRFDEPAAPLESRRFFKQDDDED